jgi:RNA polymerase-binding protein DksA
MLNKDFLNKIKNKLIEEKERLEKELGGFTKQNIHNKTDYKAKFPNLGSESDENAKEVQGFEVNLNMENTLEKELRDVNNALKRIDEGKYGHCYNCNEEIPEARLEARPTASTCIKCKTEFKKR